MFFERIGRIFPLWSALLSICFPLLATFILYSQHTSLQELEEQTLLSLSRSRTASLQKHLSDAFFSRHQHSDPYFLDHHIEALSFLQQEQKLLQPWASHPATNNRLELEHRLSFLRSEENRLLFHETKTQTSPQCKETHETQRHPIELDETDLKRLLSLIEEIPPDSTTSRPQLIIRDFHLTRKNQTFVLEMNLLKREFP